MKRRSLLAAGVGALATFPKALAMPCPPPLFGTDEYAVSTSCGAGPVWFLAAQELTWLTPVSNTLQSVAVGSINGIVDAWTGACVDQVNKDYMLINNGGHGDDGGNECYRVNLSSNSPAWTRMSNRSAAAESSSTNGTGALSDGTPTNVHGWNRCTFADGRVWYAGMDGMAPGGQWSTACWSWDKAAVDAGTYGALPVPAATPPWRYHGLGSPTIEGSYNAQGGPCAYDAATKRIWSAVEYYAGNGTSKSIWVVDTTPTTAENARVVAGYSTTFSGAPLDSAWSAIPQLKSNGTAFTNRCWIIGSTTEDRLWIMNMANPGAFIQANVSNGPAAFSGDPGAVYHQASQSILCWDRYGNTLYKLAIPDNPFVTTGWAWESVRTLGSAPSGQTETYRGTYKKFNMIEDMGNGQGCLVCVLNTSGPVYAMKLPSGGV